MILQAIDTQGNVVGEPKAGGHVNPASGTISLDVNKPIKVPLKLAATVDGEMIVRLSDPSTQVMLAELTLETDLMV